MKTAIVTDFLNQRGGAEKVTCALAELFPKADIYTLMARQDVLQTHFANRRIIQHPKLEKSRWRRANYRKLLPFYPTYIEDFDLREYDLIISSSYLWAKGVLCRPDATHISYIHTPMRQAWTKYHSYLNRANDVGRFTRPLLRYVMNYTRLWDVASANRVDHFIANSAAVKKRIQKIYRREATIIHPPVHVRELRQHKQSKPSKDDYFITVGRLVPYKKVDLLIETFAELPGQQLCILGDGNDRSRLQKMVRTDNIHFLGYTPQAQKNDMVHQARAFLFAAEEDFGMSPVEAMALGTPVIAYNKGGALDYVNEGVNGLFFENQNVQSLKNALQRFEQQNFNAQEISDSVDSFDEHYFREKIKQFIADCLSQRNHD